MNCTICGSELTGKQTKFCSLKCKNVDSNKKHQNYVAQQARARERKLQAIELKGGSCSSCGYCTNLAALVFHHEEGKDFPLDSRKFSNCSWERLLRELEKCTLLCHNCHMELHYPYLALTN